MTTISINSKFEYRIPNRNHVVCIDNTLWKQVIIDSLSEGNDGISNFGCSITDESFMLIATEKLNRMYNPEWTNDQELTEDQIEEQDLKNSLYSTLELKEC